MQGRNIEEISRRALDGSGSLEMDLRDLPEGVYVLNIKEGETQRVEKIVRLK